MSEDPHAIDGSEGPLVVRRIVVWRRLEPGDAPTPGAETAPESEHLEAKIVEVGIGAALFTDLEALGKKRDELTATGTSWTARYEPAGVLFTLGGSMALGVWLDHLPPGLFLYSLSLMVLGVALGVFTRRRRTKLERAAERRWRGTSEERALAKIERELRAGFDRFSARLREETGFRTDVRVGDIHEADRLVSIDPTRIVHASTWRADLRPNEVRYGWLYSDGRVVEQTAELEDAGESETDQTNSSE